MMKHRAYTSVFRAHLSALALAILSFSASAQQPQLKWISLDGATGTYARDISADGKIVVGGFTRQDGKQRPFIWTEARGFTELPYSVDRAQHFATAISADGLTVCGNSYTRAVSADGIVWTIPTGPIGIISPVGRDAYANDVSENGSIVVGGCSSEVINNEVHYRPYRWSSATRSLQVLPGLGGRLGWGYGVSADGSIVVGPAQDSSGKYRAFRWTQQDGMRNLGSDVRIGNFTRAYDQSAAWGISPDGNVIVGIAYNDPNEAVGFYNIFDPQLGERINIRLGATPSGFTGVYPRRTNQDGSIIVGWMRKSDGTNRAMRWTQAGGIEDLNVTYASLLGQGEYLAEALDITPDGRYIVGWGIKDGKQQGFILDTGFCNLPADVDGNGIVNDQDLLQVLFEFGNRCGQ